MSFFGVRVNGAPRLTGAVVSLAPGTATLPGLAFTGDLDTGLENPAANTLGLTVGGTERLTLDANGAVVGGNVIAAAGSLLGFYGRSVVGTPADGQVNVTNNAQAAGVGLDVGTDAILKVRTRAQSGYATVDVLGLKASGAAGASFGPGLASSLTIVNGIVTAAS